MRALMTSLPRPRVGALVAVLVCLLAASGLPAGAQTAESGGDDLTEQIEDARAEAADLAAEIEEIGRRASGVLEEYHQAQAALAEADAALFGTRQRVTAVEARVETMTASMQDRIVAMYQGGLAPSPMAFLDARDAVEFGSRAHYADAVASADRTVVQRLEDERARLADERARLEAEREQVARRAAALENHRADVEAAMAEREAALERSAGELADLVAEEQQRRAAEEAARAREEALRLASTSTTRATTTTTLGSAGDADPPDPAEPPSPPEPADAPTDLPPVHPRAGEAVEAARSKIGTPYRWGGNGPDSYDCSGLTVFAWGSVGVQFPRSSGMQKAALPPVPLDHIQPGDLLFFGDPVHHVGIYAGNGEMINAPYTGSHVRVDSIWRSDFAGAGRPG